ncbi:hypothetical protein M413DRAFT_440324 [Hebeloma cylindrosporum]|uniref:Uncharacterized protein n=1 Tax=Hebeloma cylindrosporum TaxID=76867 RepID=A0A0C3CD91_HEBCY|nr:hypothetical protein M413DRAFT_440324 [Hebeloma cylindrosporum h7]
MRLATFTPIFAFIGIFALGASACTGKGGDCTSLFSWCCGDLRCRSHTRTPPGYGGGTATTIYRTCDCQATEGGPCGFWSPDTWCCDGLHCKSGKCVK